MNCSKVRLAAMAVLVIVGVGRAKAAEVKSGEALVKAMHDRYTGSWYSTVTFTQKSTTYNPDGTTKVETWYEAASLPGKLRIDIGPPADNNGYLMVDGNLTILKNGQVAKTVPYMNILLVLGFDAYTQPAETTEKVLQTEGYDLSRFHEDVF